MDKIDRITASFAPSAASVAFSSAGARANAKEPSRINKADTGGRVAVHVHGAGLPQARHTRRTPAGACCFRPGSALERKRVGIRVQNVAKLLAAHAEDAANLIGAVPAIQETAAAGRTEPCEP